jgi:ABC-type lipoprotein export system ATPase subunit
MGVTTMNARPAIGVDRVSKRYGAVAALTDVTLEIAAGEVTAVVGPSGSGKSTLLHLIAGLDTPSTGQVVVDGRNLGLLSDDQRSDLRLRHVGFVFQAFHLFPTFTAEENVVWPLGFLGVRRREARERAAAVLAAVGLDAGTRRRLPAELSGGEQQRVAIARALVTRPRLLLADEPTGNLDAGTARSILDLLLRLNAERNLTLVVVTHNPMVADAADRTVALHGGHVVDQRPVPRATMLRALPTCATS